MKHHINNHLVHYHPLHQVTHNDNNPKKLKTTTFDFLLFS